MGWFILRNARAYDNLTNLQESLLNLQAGEVMSRNLRVLNAHQTLRGIRPRIRFRPKQPPILLILPRLRGVIGD
jgi:hypothetical protein